MLKKIGIGLAVVLVALCVGIATRPDTYHVERTATIAAPPDVVFPYVNDFHQWTQWSPFEKLDPAMKRTFGGTPSGVGAEYSWAGNSQAGEGTMTMKESAPNQRIALDLHFVKPFESSAVTEFSFKPAPEGVSVTWAMTGKNTLISKAVSLFASMDKMVGGQFEEGLASLKSVSEAEGRRRAEAAKGDKVAALSGTPSPAPASAAPAKKRP